MTDKDYLCYLFYVSINFLRMIHERYEHPFNVIRRLVSVSE
jgi:hypothetical protein